MHQINFKLNDDKIEEPLTFLGEMMSKWLILRRLGADEFCAASVTNSPLLSLRLLILIMKAIKITGRVGLEFLLFFKKAPVYWYSKQASGVKASTFGA